MVLAPRHVLPPYDQGTRPNDGSGSRGRSHYPGLCLVVFCSSTGWDSIHRRSAGPHHQQVDRRRVLKMENEIEFEREVEVKLENFQMYKNGKGIEYYRWPPEAIDALRARLIAMGPGCELIPCFAMSVQVKLPS